MQRALSLWLFIKCYNVLNNLRVCKEEDVVVLHVTGRESLSVKRGTDTLKMSVSAAKFDFRTVM
jgi:hypothetical protein